MKRIAILALTILMTVTCCLMLCSCDLFMEKEEVPEETYTVVYSDGVDTHSIKVKKGDVYTIDKPLPQKEGYDFLGLFDAEVGGTQYVSSLGTSIIAFNDMQNLVLYPQFKAKQYNLILNYGEAKQDGLSSITVNFNERIENLPGNLTVADKPYLEYQGWYTQQNSNGIKVADQNGMSTMQFNEELAKIADSNNNVQLYAGFSLPKYKVRFWSKDGAVELKKTDIEYGASLSNVSKNIVDRGIEVLSWSEYIGGNAVDLSGRQVFSDLNFYAFQYAPSARAVFKDDTKQLIKDVPVTQNYFDTVKLVNLFGRSVNDFKELGFNKVRFTITIRISEVHAGYQQVYLNNTHSVADALWKKTNIEHGGAVGATKTPGNHTFTSDAIDLSKCNDILYILYSADGKDEDDWYRHSVELHIEIFKV